MADHFPVAQSKQEPLDAPPELALNVPAAQLVQVDAPLADQVPEAQGKQAVLPWIELYCPAAQLVQEAAPLEENVPTGHV